MGLDEEGAGPGSADSEMDGGILERMRERAESVGVACCAVVTDEERRRRKDSRRRPASGVVGVVVVGERVADLLGGGLDSIVVIGGAAGRDGPAASAVAGSADTSCDRLSDNSSSPPFAAATATSSALDGAGGATAEKAGGGAGPGSTTLTLTPLPPTLPSSPNRTLAPPSCQISILLGISIRLISFSVPMRNVATRMSRMIKLLSRGSANVLRGRVRSEWKWRWKGMGGGAWLCPMKRIGGEGRRRMPSTPGPAAGGSGCPGVVVLGLGEGLPPCNRIVRQPGFIGSSVVKARSRRGVMYARGSYTIGNVILTVSLIPFRANQAHVSFSLHPFLPILTRNTYSTPACIPTW